MIDLRSDTFTLPSPEMRECAARAEVGDDYYGEDRSANRLEAHCAELFGKEAALFCTSGMLANQLAVAVQVERGNEAVTEYNYHLHLYESAQHAAFGGVVLNGRETVDGILRVADVVRAIESKPRARDYAQVQLVSVENTISHRQGRVFPLDELRALRDFTARTGRRLHLDGARLFNAHIASGVPLTEYARLADTLSVCFSKGLGAPFGSILLGDHETIGRARRLRVWHGSGFHQIGMYAEAAHYALTHQMGRLAEDHRLARVLAERLAVVSELGVDPSMVETNMVFAAMAGLAISPEEFSTRCAEAGVLALPFPPHALRFVVCRNVEEVDVRRAGEIVAALAAEVRDAARRATQ